MGSRPDGTLAVPHSIPQQDWAAPVSYGWCHGPAGTVRLFELLGRLRPGEGWDDHAAAGRRAVRESGLPARLYPGFWDNWMQGAAGIASWLLRLARLQRDGASAQRIWWPDRPG